MLYMFSLFHYNETITVVNINRERGNNMPDEKEININLLERLDLIDRLEEADKEGGYEKMKKQLAFERKLIERKLYQKPLLISR